ncbi:AraC-like DNA-binding protein [Kineococcus xinjiangensis]|uniref:AraC-like DNA-binding protein n=1 Tax=Kineococcus xinjiangensis TaxID=512762 RepID=A0A2S6IDA7_9ACTN|nr:AraC family transcriptional regulator [Kineococcus xinjiangensis]PPK92150.1 AraC-like DNA-binding protein [Kineococcus xinjiangensis]
MDALAALLEGPRARGAFVLRSRLDPPWALRVEDGAPLTVVAVVRGAACVVTGDGAVERLAAGDVCVLRGPEPYLVADDPRTAPQVVIGPDQACRAAGGASVHPMTAWGPRTWGNSGEGSTVLLTGTYPDAGEVSGRLLRALPPLLTVPGCDVGAPLLSYLAAEVDTDEPGQGAVLDRLLDLLLVAVLRCWFARAEAGAPGWYRAHSDPVAGPALRLLQEFPERPWTVASLAAEVGASRAALARRFSDVVGEPPMAFLTDWRLALAADLLLEPGSTLDAVARRVGYGSGFALSSAFLRVRGVRPAEHRALRG